MMQDVFQCDLASICGGCAWAGRGMDEPAQRLALMASFGALWEASGLPGEALEGLSIVDIAPCGLRDRTDLSFRRTAEGPVLGFWDQERTRLVDIGPCPQLSEPLRAWLAEIQQDPMPAGTKASLRLRVSPSGERGLWIDMGHVEFKALLDEGEWLRRRLAQAYVEVGQRRKPLVEEDGRLRLKKKPALLPWFETYVGRQGTPAPLYGPVSGFSQPGFRANRVLVERVMRQVREIEAERWLELGSGNGNFTLPLAIEAEEVVAVEIDRLARSGLQKSLEEMDLTDAVEVLGLSMHKDDPDTRELLYDADALLVDPPRSGLGAFVDVLLSSEEEALPGAIVYVSCHQDSFVRDVARLVESGRFRVKFVEGIDQFPQTPHCEWLGVLERSL